MCYSLLVSHTSAGADVVILGGDLNMHPQDLGNRLLRTSTGLRDSYVETAKFDVGRGQNASHHTATVFLFVLGFFYLRETVYPKLRSHPFSTYRDINGGFGDILQST